jgi:transcriptional regulator with XRE-family HTH domain
MPIDTALIVRRREQLGLSQAAFARSLGWSPQAWHRIESGVEAHPSIDRCAKIADLLGCTLDEMIGRTLPGKTEAAVKPADPPAKPKTPKRRK